MSKPCHYHLAITRIVGELEITYDAVVELDVPSPEALRQARNYIALNEAGDPDDASWQDNHRWVFNGDGTGTKVSDGQALTEPEAAILGRFVPVIRFTGAGVEVA